MLDSHHLIKSKVYTKAFCHYLQNKPNLLNKWINIQCILQIIALHINRVKIHKYLNVVLSLRFLYYTNFKIKYNILK